VRRLRAGRCAVWNRTVIRYFAGGADIVVKV
jgi:hypothetical protein